MTCYQKPLQPSIFDERQGLQTTMSQSSTATAKKAMPPNSTMTGEEPSNPQESNTNEQPPSQNPMSTGQPSYPANQTKATNKTIFHGCNVLLVPDEHTKVTAFCKRAILAGGGEWSPELSTRVTHIVVQRTYFDKPKALSSLKLTEFLPWIPVVGADWVKTCTQEGKCVSTQDYDIRGRTEPPALPIPEHPSDVSQSSEKLDWWEFISRAAPGVHERCEINWRGDEKLEVLIKSFPQMSDMNAHLATFSILHGPQMPTARDVAKFRFRGFVFLHDLDNGTQDSAQSAVSKARATETSTFVLEEHASNQGDRLLASLLDLARSTAVKQGKWVFSVPYIDQKVWDNFVKVIISEKIGCGVELQHFFAGTNNESKWLVSVFTQDFDDKDDVRHVFNILSITDICKRSTSTMFYTSHALSLLNLSNGDYGMQTNLHASRD